MVKLTNVSKKFPQFQLQDISLAIPKGCIMGLVGENGAGKSTLLHILLGLYQPDAGEMMVNNCPYTQEKQYKDGMGYVLNEDVFLPGASLGKNADYYGSFYSGYDREKFAALCERFGLSVSRKLKKLSKGEKLKFQFAFALSHNPQLLVLDEPTANFDPEFRKQFITSVLDFVSNGERSVILATHLTGELDRIADYVAFLHEGRLVFSENKEKLYDSYRLLTGEEYKLKLLREDRVVYKETGSLMSKALVRHYVAAYDRELSVEIPSIEDIMYFFLKSGRK